MFKEIADVLNQPLSPFLPCPPVSDRGAWNSLEPNLKRRLVTQGEQYLGHTFPTIQVTDFMEFYRTGNRVNYEGKLFERRNILNALVLAECVENRRRFMDDILNTVYLICGETAWQLPAHNSYVRDTPQLILPDTKRPVIDLFAAETGAVLAVAEYLLREAFLEISPLISQLIDENLDKRIFLPYLQEHFWWMGNGTEAVNNWTSWCTQNVLLAAFTRDVLKDDSICIFKKACQSLDFFLDSYGEDGCCDEGAQYYRHAGLTLLNAAEVLNGITGGAFQRVYKEPKVRNIAAYILNAHIDGIYYVNFADCSPVAGRCNAREYLFGKRTGNQDLMAFAAEDYKKSEVPLTPDEHNLFYRLQTVFLHREMTDYKSAEPICHPDIYYPSVGLFITRSERYYLAVKAGDNDDSHNHNDTGSFIIYKEGHPLFIDAGVESYTKKTFSPDRYEIWTMQSVYHNLPSFTGIAQRNGEKYKAEDVRYTLEDQAGEITMDISNAYPDERIGSYIRTAKLDKSAGITITDVYSGNLRPVILSLMTFEKPMITGDMVLIGSLGRCRITGAAEITSERIPIEDPRLKLAWSHDIYRILITMSGTRITLDID